MTEEIDDECEIVGIGYLSEEEARKALANITRYHNDDESDSESDCNDDANELVLICKAHEALAYEWFFDFEGRRISPLEYLILSRANLDTIRWFAEQFPAALENHNILGHYPLHRACAIRHPIPGLIQFLTETYPLAASKEDWEDRKWPIELLLLCGQDPSLTDIRKLIAAHPPGDDESKQKRLLVEAAIWGASSEQVMDCIIRCCSLPTSFKLTSSGRPTSFSQNCANAFSKLLPQ
jgi:hypothetical protein